MSNRDYLKQAFFNSWVLFNSQDKTKEPEEKPPVEDLVIRSQTPPENPEPGKVWLEVNGSDFPIEEWFWSGTYWYSTKAYVASTGDTFKNDVENHVQLDLSENIYIDTVHYGFKATDPSTVDGSNRINLVHYRKDTSFRSYIANGAAFLGSFRGTTDYFYLRRRINQHLDVKNLNITCFGFYLFTNTPPGTVYGSASVRYRKTKSLSNY